MNFTCAFFFFLFGHILHNELKFTFRISFSDFLTVGRVASLQLQSPQFDRELALQSVWSLCSPYRISQSFFFFFVIA